MKERLLILALLLPGLLISTAGVEAKTTVSVENTTITFDVPIVIWVPVKLEPVDPEEKEQLRKKLVDQVEWSRLADWPAVGQGEPGRFYRGCYTIHVNINTSIRFRSDETSLGDTDEHRLEYSTSQQGKHVIWLNSADPYSTGRWGRWNPGAPSERLNSTPTLGSKDLLQITTAKTMQGLTDVLGKRAENQLDKQGIELPGCFCICMKVVSKLKHQNGWNDTRATYKIPVVPDARGKKLKGSGRGIVKGNGVSYDPPAKGNHWVKSQEKATGTYKRGMIKLKITSEQHGTWHTTAGGGHSRDLENKSSWKLKAGPLDGNGYYYNKEKTTKGDTVTETIIRVQRCEQAEQGQCVTRD